MSNATIDDGRAVSIRWGVNADLASVAAIDGASFDDPWAASMFASVIRRRDHILSVLTVRGEVAGFVVYRHGARDMEVVRLAVAPRARRCGVARALVRKVVGKAAAGSRPLSALVREGNTAAHCLLRAGGMLAVAVRPDHFEDGETAYEFRA